MAARKNLAVYEYNTFALLTERLTPVIRMAVWDVCVWKQKKKYMCSPEEHTPKRRCNDESCESENN